MPTLRDIDFRYSDARTEKIHSPELLREGFVDFEARSRELLQPDKYIVYGPKGSGKTALAGHIELAAESRHDWFAKTEELDEFDFSALSFDKTVSDQYSGLAGWRFLLALRLLTLMLQDEELVRVNPSLTTLRADLEAQGLLASPSLVVIAERTLKGGGSLGFKFFADVSLRGDREVTWRPKSPAQMAEAIVDYLRSMTPTGSKYLLFVDGLDYVLRGGRAHVGTIADLLSAARAVNEALLESRVDGKVVILLRDEIARLVPSPDLTKRLGDNGIYVDWSPNLRDVFDNQLLAVVERRALAAGFTGDIRSLWDQWFPRKMHQVSSVKYVLLRTRFLPRDVISFFRAVQKVAAHVPLEPGQLMVAEKGYSDWFFRELSDALQGMVAEQVRLAAASIVREVGMEFTVQDLQRCLEARGLDELESGVSLADAMFQTHWLGNVWTPAGRQPYFSFKYRDRNAGFSPEKGCVLHLGLRKGMNLEMPAGAYRAWDSP
jgi:hypothetical protein